MSDQIKESDWKVFQKLYPRPLERFYERVVDEIQKIVTEGERSSEDRYHKIYKTAFSRSKAFMHLVSYYKEGLVTNEELNQLSEENRNRILAIVED